MVLMLGCSTRTATMATTTRITGSGQLCWRFPSVHAYDQCVIGVGEVNVQGRESLSRAPRPSPLLLALVLATVIL